MERALGEVQQRQTSAQLGQPGARESLLQQWAVNWAAHIAAQGLAGDALFAQRPAAVVLVVAGDLGSGVAVLVDAAVVALAANLTNLLDRAPGRAIKAGLMAYVPVAVALGTSGFGLALAPVVGTFAGMLPDDLGERLMIGDTGAYVLGGALGLGAVAAAGPAATLIVLVGLVALTACSEVVSFSRVIEATPWLRAIDRLGRRP